MLSAAQRIQSSLSKYTVAGSDTVSIATKVVSVWRDIDAALAPIIGHRGVAALFGRSLHLTRADHAWWTTAHEGTADQIDFAAFQSALSQQTTVNVVAFSGALLQKFVEQVNRSIRFINLGEDTASGDLDKVLGRITAAVQEHEPALVFVDSFRSVILAESGAGNSFTTLQRFIQQLGMLMTTWQATTFLIGEYFAESEPNPVFTVADGLTWMRQCAARNSVVRKLEITKMMPGNLDLFAQEEPSLTVRSSDPGMGLAVVRDLVEAHGGAILARSPGENLGSEFIVTLPLYRESDAPIIT